MPSQVLARSPARWRLRKRTLQQREAIAGVLFALPAMLGFVLWWLGPMVASAAISLTNWSLLASPAWIGFANYVGMPTPVNPIPGLVNDPLFWTSLQVTATYVVLSVPLSLLFSFSIALLLSQPIRGVSLLRAIYYLPSILPAVASSLAWLWLYNPNFGLFNAFLDAVNLPTSQWVFGETTVLPSLVVINVWASGGLMIIFLAALKGVPRQFYEAAAIDGAGALQRLWHVTVPVISPVILYTVITSILTTFTGGLVQAQFITNGGPDNATLFFALYLYRSAFQDGHMGYASAMSWVGFVLLLVLTLLILSIARSRIYYEDPGTS